MSNQKITHVFFNIKDSNITFTNDSVRREIINDVECNGVYATLKPNVIECCVRCGCISGDYSIIKKVQKQLL